MTPEELAEYRRTDQCKLDAAEHLLENLGYHYDEDEGDWTW